MVQGLWTQDRGPRIKGDWGLQIKDSGWKASLGWRPFISWIIDMSRYTVWDITSIVEMAQWRKGSPLLMCLVSEFVVGSHLPLRVFLQVLRFPSFLKNQHFQIQIQIGFFYKYHCWQVFTSILHFLINFLVNICLQCYINTHCLFPGYMCTKCYRFHSLLCSCYFSQ